MPFLAPYEDQGVLETYSTPGLHTPQAYLSRKETYPESMPYSSTTSFAGSSMRPIAQTRYGIASPLITQSRSRGGAHDAAASLTLKIKSNIHGMDFIDIQANNPDLAAAHYK